MFVLKLEYFENEINICSEIVGQLSSWLVGTKDKVRIPVPPNFLNIFEWMANFTSLNTFIGHISYLIKFWTFIGHHYYHKVVV